MRLGRLTEITRVFLEEGLGSLPDASGPGSPPAPGSDAERAVRLRRALERLGPTFVKFGQLLATRVDLFGEEFLRELGRLRSHVPPFPGEQSAAIVAQEVGCPVEEVFDEFSFEPIASASIAQVHRAKLRHTDEWVAVKVQRPDLAKSLLSDLDVLIQASRLIDRLVPAYHRSMVHRVAEEYVSRARNEIDFLQEAQAMERFKTALLTLPEFRIPRVYHELCTPRLLVMEWLNGPLLDDVQTREQLEAAGYTPGNFSRSMLRLQLGMSYEHGLVHGDTHPGNIILCSDQRIGLIDFGLNGHVPQQLRDKMLELIFYQTAGRIEEAIDAFEQVFVPSPNADLEAFRHELRTVMAHKEHATAREARLTQQLVDGLRVGARYQLKARSDLFLVVRNLTIVEGIVLSYCPDLDVVAEVQHIIKGILQRRVSGDAIPNELQQLSPMWMLTLAQRPQLVERLLRLERSFTEARSLGEFFTKEGVLQPRPPPRGLGDRGWLALAVLGGFLGGAFASWLLR